MMDASSDHEPSGADFKALYDTTGWGTERPAGFYAASLAGSWACVSVWRGGALVAFGRVISDGALHAFITEMIVHPDHQGHGLGREILARLIARCRLAGITDIQLFATRGKAGFYERHHFRPRSDDAPGMQWQGS